MIGDIALDVVLYLFSPADTPRSARIVRDDGGIWVGSVYLRLEDAQRILDRNPAWTEQNEAPAAVG